MKLPNTNIQNGKNLSGDKELVSAWSVVVNTADGLKEPVRVRCWMGRSSQASTVYATVWANNRKRWLAGHGKAGGYGYHKESAAIEAAFIDAGISDFEHFGGCGDSLVEKAVLTLARKLGYRGAAILVKHA